MKRTTKKLKLYSETLRILKGAALADVEGGLSIKDPFTRGDPQNCDGTKVSIGTMPRCELCQPY